MRCLYESPTAACKQFKLSLGGRVQTLTCRAHNHRKADETRWYVIPSAEWPPYAHPMFCADWDPHKEGAIRIGSLISCGLAPKVMGELTKPAAKALLMQRHWRWREIVAENDSEEFIEPIVTAAGNLDGKTIRLLIGGVQLPPNTGGDPYERRHHWDRVIFELDQTGAAQVIQEDWDPEVIKDVVDCKNIDDIAAWMRDNASRDWLWIEAMPHRSVVPEKSVKGKKKTDLRLVTTHELYDNLLAPFEPWLFHEE